MESIRKKCEPDVAGYSLETRSAGWNCWKGAREEFKIVSLRIPPLRPYYKSCAMGLFHQKKQSHSIHFSWGGTAALFLIG
jgi:hypothetical protein